MSRRARATVDLAGVFPELPRVLLLGSTAILAVTAVLAYALPF